MKKYIDWLFWKQMWFRTCFIMMPSWMIVIAILGYFGEPGSDLRNAWCLLFFVSWIAAISDNHNVGEIKNPFRKSGCLDGKTQQQLIDFFESLAAFALTDPVFFREQYVDLQLWEKRKFEKWLKNDKQNRIAVLQSLNIIDKLMDY